MCHYSAKSKLINFSSNDCLNDFLRFVVVYYSHTLPLPRNLAEHVVVLSSSET